MSNVFKPSIIPTMLFQASLPRLPIPKLEDTLRRYANAVAPLLSEQDFARTQRAIGDFAAKEGPKLHEQLLAIDKANKHTSYINADWTAKYLSGRTPLPIHWTPYLVLAPDPTKRDQAVRAAFLVRSLLRFKHALDTNTLEPQVFHTKPTSQTAWFQRLAKLSPPSISWYVGYLAGAYALDMSQFRLLFSSTRIPHEGKDETRQATASESRHVAVLHRGHVYRVDVFGADGQALSEAQIAGRLQAILAEDPAPAETPVGWLTSEFRDTWAKARARLEADPTNLASLRVIDDALFVVTLDDREFPADPQRDLLGVGREFLHSDGRNRWWDKSFSLHVSRGGTAAVSFEHSWGDGVAVLRCCVDAFADTKARPAVPAEAPTAPVVRLSWNLDEGSKADVRSSGDRLQKDIARTDMDVRIFDKFGKKRLTKELKVSPDAFMQLGFQAANFAIHRATRSTYESASTSGFKHGRTECIRAATIESRQFTQALFADHVSESAVRAMLFAALKKHDELKREALMGQGVDRHLFALRLLAEKQQGQGQGQGQARPRIFEDPAYAALGEDWLSTSTLSDPALTMGGFGPVSPGYALGYGNTDDMMLVNCSSFHHRSSEFVDAVFASYQRMADILQRGVAEREAKVTKVLDQQHAAALKDYEDKVRAERVRRGELDNPFSPTTSTVAAAAATTSSTTSTAAATAPTPQEKTPEQEEQKPKQ